jgi:hypothetical protein
MGSGGATGALYEPFIERDLDAIPAAIGQFLQTHSEEDLWVAIARFAVLAYAPSQHAKRAVVACRSALVVRDELGPRWRGLLVECARYAASSRPPWSEPPILDPPAVDTSVPTDRAELEEAVRSGDRLRAERWLAARLDDREKDLRAASGGDARLMLEVALSLQAHLGERGRFALLRMPVHELLAGPEPVDAPLEDVVTRAIEQKGAIEAVSRVFVLAAGLPLVAEASAEPALNPYHLGRDFAQTLIAHDIARRLPNRRKEFLAAVHHNLEHGESFEAWSFA